jgi:hypothetical protein
MLGQARVPDLLSPEGQAMTREITLRVWCEMDDCDETDTRQSRATATMTFVPGEQDGATAAGFHILVIGTDDIQEDYCTKHWIELGFDPKDEVQYE